MLTKHYTHVTNPIIATIIGQNESTLLNQILYWISKCGRDIAGQKEKWIYNSLAEWHKQFSYWSMYKLRKTIKSLEDLGLIKSIKVNAKKWNHTKWYTVDHNQYEKLLKKIGIEKNITNISPFNKINNVSLANKNTPNQDFDINSKNKGTRSTNRFVENQQIIITKNNYTNKSSYKKCENILNKNLIEEDKLNVSEKKTAKQMIELWNKVFEHSIKPIKAYSNKKSEQTLLRLYKTIFNSDLDNWREYACKVNSSQFLMGEKKTKTNFKAIFSWLIKLETIEKILNGEYGVGDRELDMNNISKNEEIKKEDTVNQIDNKVSERIRLNINESKEKEEFENYVRESGYEEDGDIYKISKIFKQIPKYSFFNLTEYKEMRKTLFDSYVVKKYMGMDRIEMRDLIRNKIGEENQINSMKYLK
jgi:hypothetical protein